MIRDTYNFREKSEFYYEGKELMNKSWSVGVRLNRKLNCRIMNFEGKSGVSVKVAFEMKSGKRKLDLKLILP